MFERFERPIKIICLGLAVLLAWQLGSAILSGDPLAHLKIPALPTLPGTTNETAKPAPKETNTAEMNKTGTNRTGATNATISTNAAHGTNLAKGTNAIAKSTNAPLAGEAGQTNAGSGPSHHGPRKPGQNEGRAGMPPGMMGQMMGGGMPGGPMGGGMNKVELPPQVQAQVDRIIDSEIFGALMRPMPLALLGIADQEAFIQATNGQTGPLKVGGEMGGVKLLRIGVNRVLVEQGGEKSELTLFGGIGGESLMPAPTNAPSTNTASTNTPSTNASIRRASIRNAGSKPPSAN
jgi:hypothetical protein